MNSKSKSKVKSKSKSNLDSSESKSNPGNSLSKVQFIKQLQDINEQVSNPAETARLKAELVGKWMKESPLEFFGEIRDNHPIFPTPLFTIVTRYTDVMEVFHNDEIFTTDIFTPKVLRDIGTFLLGMNNSPEYERQKSILRLAFPREDANRFHQIVAEELHKLLGKIAASETFDLVSQYARLLPALAMRCYLGLEEIPPEKVMQWTRPLFRDVFANINNDPQVSQEAVAARDEAAPFIDNLIARRHEHLKQHPQQPATTVLDRLLVMQTIPATCLSDEEVRNCLLGFFMGTIDLTSIAIISAVMELLNRPAILAEAIEAAKQQGDEAMAGYVWEALRFRPPGTGLFRICTQDYTLARGTDRETQIKAGSLIYAATAAAMHDPTHIDAPAEFRVGRPQQSYLFFESGIHTCFGKYLSLVQIPLAIEGLLRLGQLEIAGEFQQDRGFPESLPMNIIKPAT